MREPDDADCAAAASVRPVVDVGLIDELLALSPTERLLLNDRTLTMIEELRRGLEPDDAPR